MVLLAAFGMRSLLAGTPGFFVVSYGGRNDYRLRTVHNR